MKKKISDETLNAASKIPAATMHEALGKIGALPAHLKPISRGMKICGPALPVKGPSGCNLWLHRGIAKAQPNDVIIADVGNEREYGYWGDIMGTGAKIRGVAGLVIDGYVRDQVELEEMEFPVFAAGLSIRGTAKKFGERGTIGETITIGEIDIKQAEDYIADFVVNPSKNAVKEAYDAAHYVTYQTKNRGDFLDNVLKTGSAIKRNSGWFSWWTNYYLPFIRTPTNIAGFTFERTPGLNFLLKSWNDDFAAGGARRQKALSKLALGSSFYGMIAPLGYFNHVSGSNPRVNKKSKRDILALENEIPKSINFDEFRIGTMGMDPLAQMMSMAADAGQLAHYIADDPDNWKSYTDFTLGMIIAFGDNLKNSTYMQGVTNFAEDWTYGKQAYNNDTDDKFWKKYFQRYAASFVPTGVEQVGKFFDDDFKKITKEFDSILLKNIVENQKAIDYDILGQPIYKIGFFNRIRKNTTTGEIKRVNPTLPKLNKYFNFNDEAGVTRLFPQQVEMTEEEESAFKLVAGRLTNDGGFPAPGGSVLRSAFKFDVVPGLQQMFKEDYYQKMPREVQEKLISATISAARGFTKNEMQKDKSISERVMTEGYDLLRKDLPNIRGMNDN